MTLDELIKQKKKEKAQQELNKIVQSKLETNKNQESSATNRRKAYTPTESTKAIDRSINTSKVSLPLANEFKNQLETGKRVQPTKEQSLPVFVNKIKQEALPMAGKVLINNSIEDAKNILSNFLTGTSKSAKQSAKYIESANENNYANYRNKRATQYITSPKVSEEEKAMYRQQNNILLPKTDNNKIETNLIKRNLQERINEDNQRIQSNIENTSNPIAKKLAELTPSMGQSTYGLLASMINPVVGTGAFMTSAGGEYIDDAKQRGMNDEQAFKYGTIMGGLEGATESIGAHLTKQIGKNIAKGSTLNAAKSFGLDIAENVGEEAVMEPLSELTATLVGGKDKADWSNMGKRMLDSGINGGLASMIMGGASAGIGSSINVVNKISNGKSISINEINTAKRDVQNRLSDTGVQQEIQKAQNLVNNIQNEQNNNTRQVINQQENKMAQNKNIEQINTIENNQQTLYNNNESESGINGEIQRFQRLSGQFDTRLQQKNQSQQTKRYTRQEYEQWEQSIRPINENNITSEQKTIRDNIKRQYNKNIVFFDGSNSQYRGGASLTNPNSIYVDTTSVNEFGINKIALHEVFESDIRHNKELKEDIINPTIDSIIQDSNFQEQKNRFWEGQEDEMPSDYAIAKDILCDRFAELKSGENLDYDNVLSQETNMTIDFAIDRFEKELNSVRQNMLPPAEQNSQNRRKILNPTEISNLTYEDASTTPKLPNRNYVPGNKESSFLSNITTDAGFLNEDLRQEMAKDDNIRYYKGITNEQTLEKAYTDLQNGGQKETLNWFNKDNKNVNAEDVAKGWILLKQYQDAGDYQSAVEVAKKMRDIGTTAGQTVQAYNILSRLTPEGMFYYAQSELTEAYNKLVDGKSKEWIDKHKNEFELTPEDTQFIRDTMQEVSTMEDGYDKKLKLAEIQKLITDKIPSNAGKSIKAWMRISMLFNPKTQIRNVAGNAVILPVNMFSDSVSAGIDRLISKATGVRTTGNTNIKSYIKGFGKGLYESYSDFRHGVNTRDIAGNRFEIGDGKSFSDKNVIGRNLNRVDNLLSFMLDAGDRGFYEATFTNSINNQLVLNNTTEVTQDMIDIATTEALQRTWQDNNAYTQTVLTIRNALNGKVGKNKGMSYGLGDVLIPFAKTPANLTKAIIDYSPVGLVKTLAMDARKFKNSLGNEQYTPQLQHKLVQNLGKGMAGSFLYVLGYALASAGIATGEADDDKDVKNFMKNSLGISSYSIKIGDKTFTYDWAQPVATPLAIMTNFVKYSKDNPDANTLEKIWKSMNIGTEQLLEQSFMETLNTVLNGNGTTLENLSQSILELPARAIPTFSKQIADMIDPIQRTSFEYGKPIESSINSIKAKLPVVSKTLAPSVDTLGNEIKKYGGDNGVWNVMFNPANTNKGELSKAGKEIYDVYMQTGDITIFPRTAPYYINNKGEKINMDSSQRTEFQKVTGTYVENTLEGLLNNKDYTKLSNEEKAKVITEIVSDSYSKAKYDVLKIDSKEYQKLRNTLKNVSTTSYYDYKFKTEDIKKDKDKIGVLVKSNYSNKEKQTLYENYIKSENDLEYSTMKAAKTDINQYLKYKQQEFSSDKKDDGTLSGKSVSGSKQKKVVNYLNSMDITGNQRLLLYAMQGYTTTSSQKNQLVKYIQELDLTKQDRLKLYDKFSGFKVYKDGIVKW